MPPPPSPVLPPAWPQVLEAMQRSLAEALAAAGDLPPEPAPAAATPPWQPTLEQLDRPLPGLFLRQTLAVVEGLLQDVADREGGVKAGHRVLRDVAEVLAAEGPERLAAQCIALDRVNVHVAVQSQQLRIGHLHNVR